MRSPHKPLPDETPPSLPRLATEQEVAIAEPLAEEPPPSVANRAGSALFLGLCGAGFIAGAIPETVRLLGLGLVNESLGFIVFLVLGAALLMSAGIAWRRGMGEALAFWPWVAIVAAMLIGAAENLSSDRPSGGDWQFAGYLLGAAATVVSCLWMRPDRPRRSASPPEPPVQR